MHERKNIIENFSSDRPINSRAEDSLDRKDFAKSLASAINGWRGDDSIVIALYGSWGSGKSSIKNMALETLKESKDTCPEIIEFNPWQWSGQDKLAEVFFQEIGKAIGRTDKSKVNKKIAQNIRLYGTRFQVGSFVAKSFYSSLFIVFSIIGIIGGSGWASESFNFISTSLGVLAFILFLVFRFGGSFAERLADMFEASDAASNQTLSELKEDITKIMKQLRNNVLIVIDDIDRLNSEEIKLIFRLIKANADFPKIVYFLLFQRDIIEKCLSEEVSSSDPDTGKDYLEKIVQIGFNIPHVEIQKIHKFLNDELKNILGDNVTKTERWRKLFTLGISPYFQNLRDVKRFISTLQFHSGIFNKRGVFEVNSIDLCAIEVLRTFESSVFYNLSDNKMLLLGDDLLFIPENEGQNIEKINSIVNLAHENNSTKVREIIIELFPRISHLLEGSSYSREFASEWLVDKRICSSEFFDRYFLLKLSEDNISQTDIENIMSMLCDRKKLINEFKKFIENEKISTMLYYILSYAVEGKIVQENAQPLITALFDIGDELSENIIDMYGPVHWIVIQIVNSFIQKETDDRKKWQLLKDTICISNGIFIPIQIIGKLENEVEKNEEYFLRESDIKYLQTEFINKIKQPSKLEYYISYPNKLKIILESWSNWSSSKEPNKRIEELISSKEGLLSFLEAFLETRESSHRIDGLDLKKHYSMNLSKIEKLISIDILANNIKKQAISTEILVGSRKMAVDIFKIALDRRQEGKPDDDLWDDE